MVGPSSCRTAVERYPSRARSRLAAASAIVLLSLSGFIFVPTAAAACTNDGSNPNAWLDGSMPPSGSWWLGGATITIGGSDLSPSCDGQLGNDQGLEWCIDSSVNNVRNCTFIHSNEPQFIYDLQVSLSGSSPTEFWFRAVDDIGKGSTPQRYVVNFDETAPIVGISLGAGCSPSPAWCRASTTVTFSASDPESGIKASTRFCLIDNVAKDCAVSTTVTGQGSHTAYTSAANNVGLGSDKSVTFQLDSVVPTASHTFVGTAGSNGWYTSAVSVRVDVTDTMSGPAGIKYALDGSATWTTVLGDPADIPVNKEGTTSVKYKPFDNAANEGTESTVAVKIDTVRPTSSMTLAPAPNEWGWNNACVSGSITGTEGTTSGFQKNSYSLDGGAWTHSTSNPATTSSVCTAGSHTIDYTTTDNAGLQSFLDSDSFNIDRTLPVVAIGTPAAGSWQTDDFYVGMARADDATSGVRLCEAKIDGLAAGTWEEVDCWSVYVPVRTGAQTCALQGSNRCTVSFRATDYAGNTASTSRSFSIDIEAPVTTETHSPSSGGPSGWYSGSVTYTFACSDAPAAAGSGCSATESSLDGDSWIAGTRTVSGQGPHTLSYRSRDIAGNYEATHEVTVNLDLTGPLSDIVSPDDNSVQGSSFEVSFSDSDTGGSDLSVCQYRVDTIIAGATVFPGSYTDRPCNGSVTIHVGVAETTGCRATTGLPVAAQCRVWTRAEDGAANFSPERSRTYHPQ